MKRTGRPPLDDEPAKVVIKVRVTSAQRLELRRVADENGTGMSGIIREAVSEYCADYRERGPFGGNKTRRPRDNTDMPDPRNSKPGGR